MSSFLFPLLFSLTLLPATVQAQRGMPLWTNRYSISGLFGSLGTPRTCKEVGARIG